MALNEFFVCFAFYTFNSDCRAEIMHRKLLEIRWLVKVHNMLTIIIMDEQYCGLEAQSSFETSGKWLVSSHF